MRPPCDPLTIRPVATVHTCFGGKFGVPRQPGLCPSAWGTLVFLPEFRSPEAIRGLEGFSHLWLVFGFHQTRDQGWHPTVRPPRLGGNERVGVFATRSTFRPNPLGLSLVRLEGIDPTHPAGPVLELGGVDLVDGTPVYDIKPYLPYAEAPADATGGFAHAPPPVLEVVVDAEIQVLFDALPSRTRAVIREALALDPRPATRTDDANRTFGALLCDLNVRFQITGNTCRIQQIEGVNAENLES